MLIPPPLLPVFPPLLPPYLYDTISSEFLLLFHILLGWKRWWTDSLFGHDLPETRCPLERSSKFAVKTHLMVFQVLFSTCIFDSTVAGLHRATSVATIMAMSFACMGVLTVLWFGTVCSMTFGPAFSPDLFPWDPFQVPALIDS